MFVHNNRLNNCDILCLYTLLEKCSQIGISAGLLVLLSVAKDYMFCNIYVIWLVFLLVATV